MAEQHKIIRKQFASFASGHKDSLKKTSRTSNSGLYFSFDLGKPQTDRHLENTLVDNIGIKEPLTKREIQILRSILAGRTNKQIAMMLSRSRRTIEYHRNRLMRKLNAHNTVELVKRAVALGLD